MKIFRPITAMRDLFARHLQRYGAPIKPFAIFGLINYPLFFIVWHFLTDKEYHGFGFRLVATILCLLLLVHDRWPSFLKPWLGSFWYASVTLCLPFFATYSFLRAHGSIMWLTNAMLVLFWLFSVTDWMSFTLMLLIGISGGYSLYVFQGHEMSFLVDPTTTFINYGWAIVIGVFFSRHRLKTQEKIELEHQARTEAMEMLSATIAHELRTPLATIEGGVSGLKLYLPDLIQGYEAAKAENLEIPRIYPSQMKAVNQALHDIGIEVRAAHSVIDMLLINVQQHELDRKSFVPCSMRECIQHALERYPFTEEDRAKVHFKEGQDFHFLGSELLTIHIIFNLLKNALYYLMAAGKGDIEIWLHTNGSHNYLHFRDTGKGIPPETLPHIFDKFYTKTYHGHGVGLAFCKMVMVGMGGDITCHSVVDEYAEFVLEFPPMDYSLMPKVTSG